VLLLQPGQTSLSASYDRAFRAKRSYLLSTLSFHSQPITFRSSNRHQLNTWNLPLLEKNRRPLALSCLSPSVRAEEIDQVNSVAHGPRTLPSRAAATCSTGGNHSLGDLPPTGDYTLIATLADMDLNTRARRNEEPSAAAWAQLDRSRS
jgi:hypothetical protein